MKNIPYSQSLFRKILVPVIYGSESLAAITAAHTIAGRENIELVGLVGVDKSKSLSTATRPARKVREMLRRMTAQEHTRNRPRVRVSYNIWQELVDIVKEEGTDLLILEWPDHLDALGGAPEKILAHPPCDIAIVRGPILYRPARLLVPMRGGPYAELALRLSLSIANYEQTKVTALNLLPSGDVSGQEASFRGLANILANIPEVTLQQLGTDDPAGAILEKTSEYDLVVLGVTAQLHEDQRAFGPVVERILRESQAAVIAVKTSRPLTPSLAGEAAGQTAISVLVDKWFAENTFHADEFSDLHHLLDLKRSQELSISIALPALNEEATVGKVIHTLKSELMEKVPLVDEIVLVDSHSSDRTREIAGSFDIPVVIHQQTLPQYGARPGKGEALWKSQFVTCGDILLWIDTDIVNIHPRFIYGLLGPLLINPRIDFVKGFYRRPIKVGDKIQAGGGGRVTELTARPMLNLFYPELSGIIQPLSGEYGGRRSALEQMSFFSGYGVEIGLLIDIFEKFGLGAIAQVDLEERIHHNQPLESLSKMSFAIIQAVIQRMERRLGGSLLEEVNKTMKLIRYVPGHFFLEVEEIAERDRPPMAELPEYREIHKK
jgi:glycosyltransferase involved in cell wall biosynthesis/nucleotide-binding universal stress UspA family protein